VLLLAGEQCEVEVSADDRRGALRLLTREAEERFGIVKGMYAFHDERGRQVTGIPELLQAMTLAREGRFALEVRETAAGKAQREMQVMLSEAEQRFAAEAREAVDTAQQETAEAQQVVSSLEKRLAEVQEALDAVKQTAAAKEEALKAKEAELRQARDALKAAAAVGHRGELADSQARVQELTSWDECRTKTRAQASDMPRGFSYSGKLGASKGLWSSPNAGGVASFAHGVRPRGLDRVAGARSMPSLPPLMA